MAESSEEQKWVHYQNEKLAKVAVIAVVHTTPSAFLISCSVAIAKRKCCHIGFAPNVVITEDDRSSSSIQSCKLAGEERRGDLDACAKSPLCILSATNRSIEGISA